MPIEAPARFFVRGWCVRCRKEKIINRAGYCPKCWIWFEEQQKKKRKLPSGGPIYFAPFEN